MATDLSQNALFFFPVAGFIIIMAAGVLLIENPIKAFLSLVMSVLGVGIFFLAQGAVFLGVLQFVVCIGAAMVLTLINVNEITDKFFEERFSIGKVIKIGSAGIILGLPAGTFSLKTYENFYPKNIDLSEVTKDLMVLLFKNYMFLFGVVGVLLLMIVVTVITVNKVELK